MSSSKTEALEADYEHSQVLIRELTKTLEKKGEELLRYKRALAEVLSMSLVYKGTPEIDLITAFITGFATSEVKR